MKPKTAIEIEIVGLSKNLPKITQQQNELAFSKCFTHSAVVSRKSIFCLECGHNWKVSETKKLKKPTCEKCCKKLVITDKYYSGLKRNRLLPNNYNG